MVQRRIEDGIEYLDSTTKSKAYINRNLEDLHKIVLDDIAALTKAAAEGAAAELRSSGLKAD